jgi:Zn-dependent alcohol dehydrogenase
MVNSAKVDAVEAVKDMTDGGADYVFVTVGSCEAILKGFSMSGSRGMTVVVGLPKSTETIDFSPLLLIKEEKILTGGYMGSSNWQADIPRLIELYKAGILKLDELITHRFPLNKINEAIEEVEKGEVLRNVIVFEP